MRRALAVLLICASSACSSNSDTARVAAIVWGYVSGSAPRITRDQAAAVPYATMGMSLGSGPEGLLVLGTIMQDRAEWYAGDRILVTTTRNGQIMRTVGLPYDLGELRQERASGVAPAMGEATEPARLTFDFPDLGVFEARAACSQRDVGTEAIDILGASIPTRHIVQHCEVPVLKWSFDNDFWEDPGSGLAWRSSQHIHPQLPVVHLEVLRPIEATSG